MMHPVVALTLEKVGVQGSVISIMAKMSTLDPMTVSMDIAKIRIAVIYFFVIIDLHLKTFLFCIIKFRDLTKSLSSIFTLIVMC